MLQSEFCDDNIGEMSIMVRLINQYRISKHINSEYAIFPKEVKLVSVLGKGKWFNIYCLDTIESHQMTLQALSFFIFVQCKIREIKQKYLAFQMEGE